MCTNSKGCKNTGQDLRIASVLRGKKISLKVDGNQVIAYEGETVHAALTAAGIRRLKDSKSIDSEKPGSRGIFCGMGICYECLVTIDHVQDQRACMTFVEDQMEIITNES
ncbi:MAG: (2Fe-2S)-binding protein [Desulfobacula sp.]|jgi:predicted molibdopterin-dependent oxidoreductase YjgC|nr:(2Fe-2S)-binding protein [Desulfobacula sp.]MBT6340340.1 (2Fe-2S)-binding protein [Desulfobacula sp.]